MLKNNQTIELAQTHEEKKRLLEMLEVLEQKENELVYEKEIMEKKLSEDHTSAYTKKMTSAKGKLLGMISNNPDMNAKDIEKILYDITGYNSSILEKDLAIYHGDKKASEDYVAYNEFYRTLRDFALQKLFEAKNRKGVSEHGHYQRCVRDTFFKLEKELTPSEKTYILKMMTVALYDTKLNNKTLTEIWGTHKVSTSRIVKKFIEKNILKEVGKKEYQVNNSIFFSGKKSKKQYDVKVYVDFLEKCIKKIESIEAEICKLVGVEELKHSATSTLFTLIPYTHFETLDIVYNNTESICMDGETVYEATTRECKEGKTILKFVGSSGLLERISKGSARKDLVRRDLLILEMSSVIRKNGAGYQMNHKLVWCKDDLFNDSNTDLYLRDLSNNFFKAEESFKQQQKRGSLSLEMRNVLNEIKMKKKK